MQTKCKALATTIPISISDSHDIFFIEFQFLETKVWKINSKQFYNRIVYIIYHFLMMMPFTINVQERRSERARVHSQNILFGEKHKLMMVKLFFFRKETRGGNLYYKGICWHRWDCIYFLGFWRMIFLPLLFCKINLMPNAR